MSLAAAMTTIAANLYKVTGRSYTTVDGCTRAQVLTGIDTVATLRPGHPAPFARAASP